MVQLPVQLFGTYGTVSCPTIWYGYLSKSKEKEKIMQG
jgi:hypothetical protein